jgi:hypothetical protein
MKCILFIFIRIDFATAYKKRNLEGKEWRIKTFQEQNETN